MDGLSASDLLTEAARVLGAGDYDASIPYLKQYLVRMDGIDDDRVAALMQEVRLKLGKIMIWQDNPGIAREYLAQYMEKLPLYKPREALKLLAVSQYEACFYDECVKTVKYALTQPEPRGVLKKETVVDYDSLSKDELGGFSARKIKRMEQEGDAVEEDLRQSISNAAPEAEPAYSIEELVLLHMTLAEASTALEDWQASLEPYRFVIENSTDDSRRGYAILQTVNSLIALKRAGEAKELVKALSRTDARYDVRVNMALMKIAAALADENELDSALILYRMVLPRRVLLAHKESGMNELRRKVGLFEIEVSIQTNEMGRTVVRFLNKVPGFSDLTGAPGVAALPEKPAALMQMEEMVGTLASMPPYETEVLYRTGSLYAQVGRPWEAVEALDEVARKDESGDIGQRAFAESLQVLVDPLEEYALVEQRGMAFLADHAEGLGPRMIAQVLCGSYQKQKLWKKIKALLPLIKGFVPSAEPDIRQYECELYYMQAIADLMLFNYEQAEGGFAEILADFPDSHQQENATYWHAMSLLFLQRYETAYAELEAYAQKYPQGDWLAEAAFHGGVCLYSLGKAEEAQARFSDVIATWPESAVYPDACSLRGDLLAAQGMLDAAQHDYEEAIATALNVKQDSYAVFQLAAMFDLEARYNEIIETVDAYLKRRGPDADVAKAAYWTGKTRLAQGNLPEAVRVYRETILSYGGDVQQEGVDLIISELSRVVELLDSAQRTELEEQLYEAVLAAENEVLRLRLEVLLAEMNGTALELGERLIGSQKDLSVAAPPVLALICRASFEKEDFSRADEILTLFKTRYEDSGFMRDAYRLRAFDLYSQGELNQALQMVQEAQGLYGTQPDAAWAQLLKGRIELDLSLYDQSAETFRSLLKISEWRGAPYAEATFRLGQVEEARGDLRKAFAWYQRTYFQYKGHADGYWAAEGYLASARCLQRLGLENDRHNTFRAMLFDKYVNQTPQADVARAALGAEELLEIRTMLVDGMQTNLTVILETGGAQ
jgi:TolA-binding protein